MREGADKRKHTLCLKAAIQHGQFNLHSKQPHEHTWIRKQRTGVDIKIGQLQYTNKCSQINVYDFSTVWINPGGVSFTFGVSTDVPPTWVTFFTLLV